MNYQKLQRVEKNNSRYYICPQTNLLLPSVTTILDKVCDKTFLETWELRVGEKKADEVRREGLALGNLLHAHLEAYVMNVERPKGTNIIRQMAAKMADQIISNGLIHLEKAWGIETGLYMPGLYAGTADLVGIYKGEEAILDYKNAKKMRTEEMIQSYFSQVSAYAMAHDELYGSKITTAVIFMVDRNYEYKEFILDLNKLTKYKDIFINQLEEYIKKYPLEENI